MSRLLSVALIFVISLSVAGCADTPEHQVRDAPHEREAPSTVDDGAHRYTAIGSHREKTTRWENGTFSAHHHSFPLGQVTSKLTNDTTWDHYHDISGQLPVGTISSVKLEVEWDQSVTGWLQLRMEHDPGTTYLRSEDYSGGHGLLEAVLLRASDQTSKVGVRYNNPDAQDEVPYRFKISVETWGDQVPAGVPVALPVPEEASAIRFHATASDSDASYLLWDPADRFVGRFEGPAGEHPLPEHTIRGEYIFMAMGVEAAEIFLVGDADVPIHFRPLAQSIEQGEVRTITSSETIRWTFDVERSPLSVSFLLVECTLVRDAQGMITGPDGELFSFDQPGTLVVSDLRWDGPRGHPGLVPGRYEAVWQSAASVDAAVTHTVTHYARQAPLVSLS